MEHATVTNLDNGMYSIVPDEGYDLYNRITGRKYSDVITSSLQPWYTVLNGIPPEPHVRTLEDAKMERIAALMEYDSSPAVNSFSIGGVSMWINNYDRDSYLSAVQSERRLGGDSVSFQGIELPLDVAENIIDQINRYARLCVDNTEAHKVAINALTTIEGVDAYDFTFGYPQKLSF